MEHIEETPEVNHVHRILDEAPLVGAHLPRGPLYLNGHFADEVLLDLRRPAVEFYRPIDHGMLVFLVDVVMERVALLNQIPHGLHGSALDLSGIWAPGVCQLVPLDELFYGKNYTCALCLPRRLRGCRCDMMGFCSQHQVTLRGA